MHTRRPPAPAPPKIPRRLIVTTARGTVAAIAAAALAWTASPPVHAQSRRPPTAAEKQALTRFTDVLFPLLDQFGDANWQKTDDLFDGVDNVSINIDPGVPLDDCIGFDRTYQVTPDSQLFNERLKPLYDQVQKVTDDMVAKMKSGTMDKADGDALDKLNTQIQRLSKVTLTVCANAPNVEASALRTKAPSLVPGVVAHKVSGEVCNVDAPNCYVILAGNWATATDAGTDGLYTFKFAHKAGSPYLENVVIKLSGAEDRIQEMLKKVPWARLTQGLAH